MCSFIIYFICVYGTFVCFFHSILFKTIFLYAVFVFIAMAKPFVLALASKCYAATVSYTSRSVSVIVVSRDKITCWLSCRETSFSNIQRPLLMWSVVRSVTRRKAWINPERFCSAFSAPESSGIYCDNFGGNIVRSSNLDPGGAC